MIGANTLQRARLTTWWLIALAALATPAIAVDGVIEATRLFTRSPNGLIATGLHPAQLDKLTRAGVDPARYLRAAS